MFVKSNAQFNAVQFLNAVSPITVTVDGIVISVRLEQFKNVPFEIDVIVSGQVIDFSEDSSNTFEPMLVTLLGITIVSS